MSARQVRAKEGKAPFADLRDTRVRGTQINTYHGSKVIVLLLQLGLGPDGHKSKDGEDDESDERDRGHRSSYDGLR